MDDLASIAELIARGDDSAAFARLRAQLGWPHGRDLADGDLPRYLELLGDLASRRDGQILADLAAAVREDPDSPDRLYDLGYALIDAGAPGIAASLLWRCLRLVGDSEEVVCELVSALESALAYRDALDVLEAHAGLRARSFLCRYLYAFNAAMSGQLDLARSALPALAPDTAETEVMRDAIAAMIERGDRIAGALPLDDRDLRGWHYVLTGGLVMHQSPYGYDDPMRGRYAWLHDSLDRIATGLARLAPLLDEVDVECIYAPPGRDHAILARAASVKLGIPLAEWPTIGSPAPGLVVAYDLAALEPADVQRLAQRRPGQILFAHAAPWTQDAPVAPDVTTLLYQSLVAPWSKLAEAGELVVEDVVADLVAATGLEEVDLAADEPARWRELVARAWPPAPGTRSRLWAGGPVPSNRFE
jgi:hypothetical protein|nr:hypothetical protein [Kofleriaceae bacterium]